MEKRYEDHCRKGNRSGSPNVPGKEFKNRAPP